MKFYVTDILSTSKIEFEALDFKEAKLWVYDNAPPNYHYIGIVDVPFWEWHKYKGDSDL